MNRSGVRNRLMWPSCADLYVLLHIISICDDFLNDRWNKLGHHLAATGYFYLPLTHKWWMSRLCSTPVFKQYTYIKLTAYQVQFLAFHSVNTLRRSKEMYTFNSPYTELSTFKYRYKTHNIHILLKGNDCRLSQRLSNSRESACSSSMYSPNHKSG